MDKAIDLQLAEIGEYFHNLLPRSSPVYDEYMDKFDAQLQAFSFACGHLAGRAIYERFVPSCTVYEPVDGFVPAGLLPSK